MEEIKVSNQTELDAALKAGKYPICIGSAFFEVSDSSTVTAYDSSTVTAYDSSTVRASDSSTVTAYGSSTVTAYGSSTVTAYDSSTVTAYDSSTVTAYDSSTVTASSFVAVTKHGTKVIVTGGHVIEIPKLDTPELWCEFYGIAIEDGVATLYKAVNDDYTSPHGALYKPGEKTVALDWDGGKQECGRGLHFSPRPFMAVAFHPEAKRFIACQIPVSGIAVHPDGNSPEKVKAESCFCACEVELDGNEVEK